jgi:phosphonate transport system substrate-binding protein
MRHAAWVGAVLAAVAALVAAALFVRVRDLSASGTDLAPTGPATYKADTREEKIVGVVSRLAPSTLYEGYQPILDYLSHTTPYRFRLRASRGYRDAVEDLLAGRTQAAFLGSLLYVEARAAHGVEPLVRPRNARGEAVQESLVVVREDSPIRDLEGLAGRVVAVPPADSLSANWLRRAVPTSLQFRTVSYGHHEAVVRSVLRGLCDAGVVKERATAEHLGHGLRVLARSGLMPSAPLVVAAGADPAFAAAVTRALLALDPAREKDRRILSGWDPDFAWGFAPASDRDYDPVRALRLVVAEWP